MSTAAERDRLQRRLEDGDIALLREYEQVCRELDEHSAPRDAELAYGGLP